MKIALCGNPNVGKTTLFNRITRSDAPVGNWHGVTVEALTKRRGDITVTDLPGAYSLTARTRDEEVARDGILYGDHDCYVCVAEVNDLRRNLYIFMQLAEAGKPTVLVVNMMDEARGRVDLGLLSRRLGVPVIGASVKDKNPRDAIIAAARSVCGKRPTLPDYVNGFVGTDKKIADAAKKLGLPEGFCALKICERDGDIINKTGISFFSECVGCNKCASDEIPARLRYGYIDRALEGVIERGTDVFARTKKIDKVLLGKAAVPVFLAVMAAVFITVFEAGKPISALISSLMQALCGVSRNADMPEWLCSLLADGIISGVGAVLSFLPQIVLLFLFTSLLQDSGYMARVAFVSDGFFKRFGLSGRAAFSVALGLGCSATAVLSTRGISGSSARKRAAIAAPFCPCSARLTVFTALAAYFGLSGFAVAAMYILGFCAALAVLMILSRFGKKDVPPLIMEMPPYRLPNLKRVMSVVWNELAAFLIRVGSTVLAVCVIMWVLCNFSVTQGFVGGPENSIMQSLARFVAPLFAPLGFGNWRAVAALISGVAAKETLISVMGALGGAGAALGGTREAISFMIFSCLYVPCVATLSALVKETGYKGAAISFSAHTLTAYAASLAFYGGSLLYCEHRTVFAVTVCCIFAAAVFAIALKAVISRVRGKRRRDNLTAGKDGAELGRGDKWEKSTNSRPINRQGRHRSFR